MIGPSRQELGGVASFCDAISRSYPGHLTYFSVPLGLARKPLLLAATLWRAVGVIRKADAVHINTSLNAGAFPRDLLFLALAKVLQKPVALYIHGWSDEFFSKSQRLIRNANQADVILVLASRFRSQLLEAGITKPIVVETTCFDDSGEIVPKEKKHGQILFLARVIKEKGVFELAEACQALQREFPGLHLHVAGTGPDYDELREKFSGHSSFLTLHGFVSGVEKAELLAKCEIFGLPTAYGEGLPVSILEAMASEMALVVSPTGGIVDNFVDGRHGIFVEPRNQAAIQNALRELLLDNTRCKAIGRSNRIEAISKYSQRMVASRLAQHHDKYLRKGFRSTQQGGQ